MDDIKTLNEQYWDKLNEKIKNYSNFNPKNRILMHTICRWVAVLLIFP